MILKAHRCDAQETIKPLIGRFITHPHVVDIEMQQKLNLQKPDIQRKVEQIDFIAISIFLNEDDEN